MKNTPLMILLLFSVAISCKKEDKGIEAIFLATSIENLTIDSPIKWIVILPELGCRGCIQEGEDFMQKYIDNKGILFILTKIESLKILQKKIDIKLKGRSNVYIDKNSMFNIPTNNNVYPCIVQMEKGKIKSYEFQSPKNREAFDKLKKRILIAQ